MAYEPMIAVKVDQYECLCFCGDGGSDVGKDAQSEEQVQHGKTKFTVNNIGAAFRKGYRNRGISKKTHFDDDIEHRHASESFNGSVTGPHAASASSTAKGPQQPLLSSIGFRRTFADFMFRAECAQQVDSSVDPQKHQQPSSTTQEGNATPVSDMLPRELLDKSDALEWVQEVVSKIWPKVDAAVHNVARTKIEPRIQEMSPLFRGVYFKTCTLGRQMPKFKSIEVWDAPCLRSDLEQRGIELRVDVAWEASVGADSAQIELADRYTRMAVGVKSLTLTGELIIRLDPLLHHPPIIGGVVVYFLDPPVVEARFAGLAKIADSALLQGSVRNIINREISDVLVLPNVAHIALVQDEDIVDSAIIKDPKPLGVLRVKPLSAKNIAGVNCNPFGKATSDPYLRFILSADEWTSSVVYKNCNPEWPDAEFKDFLVYDYEQKLRIDVHDWGPFKSTDILGRAGPFSVLECLERSKEPMNLTCTAAEDMRDEVDSETKYFGNVTCHFCWLRIVPGVVAESGAMVRLKFDELYLPATVTEERVAIRARVGKVEKNTKFIKNRKKYTKAAEHMYEIEQVICLLLQPGVSPENQVLEIEVITSKKRVLGTYALNLKDVTEATGQKKTWPNKAKMRFVPSPKVAQMLSASSTGIRVEVVVSWLGLQEVDSEEALEECDVPNVAPFQYRATSTLSLQTVSLQMKAEMKRGSILPQCLDKLRCLNGIVNRMWPKVMNIIQVTMQQPDGRVNQKFQAKMPWLLNQIRFSRFVLGSQPPEFELLRIREAPEHLGQEGMQGVEMHLRFKLGTSTTPKDSDISISTGVMGTKLGLRSLAIRGELVVRLEPLLEELPVVGGIVVCCLNRPKVDMQFSGLAARIVDRGMEGSLRNLIDWGISSCLVMPNVMCFPIGKEDQGVDLALLRFPKLIGVLRVRILEVKMWMRSNGIIPRLRRICCLNRCSTWLQLRLSVGDESHVFDDVFNPLSHGACAEDADVTEEFEKNYKDFFIYDDRQFLEVELINPFGFHSVVAKADPLAVDASICDFVRQPLELKSPSQRKRSHCDAVAQLKCQRFDARFGSKGRDSWSVVRVKFDEIYMPAGLLLPEEVDNSHFLLGLGASVAARVGQVEKVTPLAKYYVRTKDADTTAINKTMSELCRAAGENVELEVESVLHLPVWRDTLETEILHLEVRSKAKGLVGSTSLALAEVVKQPDLRLDFTKGTMLKLLAATGEQSELMVVVNIMGLETTIV